MASVSVAETFDADADAVRSKIRDVEPFMRAAGFDEVELDGRTLTIANQFVLARIELTLELIDDPDAVLAYEQRDGIFERMTTRYTVTDEADGVRVDATTDFALDAALVGSFLDATVIRRQRRNELNAQFDYLEAELSG